MADMPKNLPGLILVKSHAQMVAEGKKTIFIKSEEFQKYVGKELFVIAEHEAWAIIKFSAPKKITIKQFEELRSRHKISDEERREWWGGKRNLYAYKIFPVKSFSPAIKAEYEEGPKVFVREVSVSIKEINPEKTLAKITRSVDHDLMDDFGIRPRQVDGEVRNPMVRTLGDYIEKDIDVERVLTDSIGDNTDSEINEEEKDEPMVPVRQPVPGTFAEKISKMRSTLAHSNREVITEPESVTKVRKQVGEMDLLSRFKRKLQANE